MMVINFYDTHSVKALVDARQAHFHAEAYQIKIALEAKRAAESAQRSHPVRRAVGSGLIRAGEWVCGSPPTELPRLQQSA